MNLSPSEDGRRERGAHAPAATQGGHGPRLQLVGEAEVGQQPFVLFVVPLVDILGFLEVFLSIPVRPVAFPTAFIPVTMTVDVHTVAMPFFASKVPNVRTTVCIV